MPDWDGVMSSRSSRLGSSHLRTKIVALLLSLAALWAFAAWVTLREGLNLLWVQTYNSRIYQPSEPLLLGLQAERRMSMVYLGAGSNGQHGALDAQRHTIDELAGTFKASATSRSANLAADAELQQRIGDAVAGLDGLKAVRASIDARTVDRPAAAAAYTRVVDSIYQVYFSLGKLDDQAIADDTLTLTQLSQVRELVSQEDALLAGAIAAGRLSDVEYAQFTQLVGAQRVLAGGVAAKLPAGDRARYDQMVNGAAFSDFRALEDQVIGGARTSLKLPMDAGQWQSATEPVLAQVLDIVVVGGRVLVDRATPVAIWVVVRVLLAAGLGLLAVIASIIISITTARSLFRQLLRLRDAANDLANERLPAVMEKLSRGERVDVQAEAPPLEFGSDEIGQVGQAFNAVQESAIRAAVEQAELRKSVRDVFVSIARRSQGLLHRQLKMLDAMEREETDAADLDALFRVDHLATRMRRNAENLIVLSGGVPGRAWRRPVPVIDVIRAATAEIEDYARVNLQPIPAAGVIGRVVGDVIHLLAELVENATSFSPPHTMVQVSGQIVGNGYVVEIEDRGLGMGEAALAAANDQVRNPPEFQLSGNVRLGLYVVGRLAERHDIGVHLRRSPYGGTTAIVLIPSALIVSQSDGAPAPDEDAPVNGSEAHVAAAPVAARPQLAHTTEPAPGSTSRARHAAVAVMSRPGEGALDETRDAQPEVVALDPPATASGAEEPRTDRAFGLPRRSRKPLKAQPAVPAPPPSAPSPSPEEARARMSAFQQGSLQARQASDADGRDGGGESAAAVPPAPAGTPTELS
ncbi:nitrate- and nitrite sensing domain-containing protein [Dactylosporangium darangshiense]|uniref:histidine kinase n=3 Tax=Dactylosporangium darangshiense TaxID=579108 RepID=A0ABP8DW63_9ACTN